MKKIEITLLDGNKITTNTEFRKNLRYSESGTMYLLCYIEGKPITLRKHWSYTGDDWDVWSGHEFETMKSLHQSVHMVLLGDPQCFYDEEGTESRPRSEFQFNWGHYNVEFTISED